MSNVVVMMIARGHSGDIVLITKKISLISSAGTAKQDYYPVTKIGMEEFAWVTLELIRSRSEEDIKFVVEEIQDDARTVAKLFLTVPDAMTLNIHNNYLGPTIRS